MLKPPEKTEKLDQTIYNVKHVTRKDISHIETAQRMYRSKHSHSKVDIPLNYKNINEDIISLAEFIKKDPKDTLYQDKMTIAFQLIATMNDKDIKKIKINFADISLENILYDTKNKKIVFKKDTPILGKNHKEPLAYESNLKHVSVNILEKLGLQPSVREKIFLPMQNDKSKPKLDMVLLQLSEIALDKNYKVWNSDQHIPSPETCEMLFKIASALNEYRYHLMKTDAQMFSISHSRESLNKGEKLLEDLSKLDTVEDMNQHLKIFLESYSEGKFKNHSLKVLLAKSILVADASSLQSEESRKGLVNDLVETITPKIASSKLRP